LGKAAVVVVATILIARVVVPRVLSWVDASRSREIFLLSILALCIGTALLTSLAGLSLALGAFLGGMVVADTEYGHRAMGDILPLRDAFLSVFFVSLGMLFDANVIFQHPVWVLVLLLGFLGAKGLLATVSALAMRFPARVAWLAGVGLAQFGEFGFVLVRLGESHGVIDAHTSKPLLAAGIASMFLTPLLVRAAPHVTAGERLLAPLERLIGVRSIDEADEPTGGTISDHIVIVGFGVAGRFAARALAACEVPFVVLELNADNVRVGKREQLPVYYGDATSVEALGHAHLEKARLLVLLMNDPQAAQRVVDSAKRVAPQVPILMRTRYLAERGQLLQMGAKEVVAEEVEGAAEMIARMLREVEVPRNLIDAQLHAMRQEVQPSARAQTVPRNTLSQLRSLDELKIESAAVVPGCRADGRSVAELQLRSRTNALLVGVRREGALLTDISSGLPLQAGDVVYLVGELEPVREAIRYFTAPDAQEPDPAHNLGA
jgi:CPA2 family monovalent cation:H+ antiporter-2